MCSCLILAAFARALGSPRYVEYAQTKEQDQRKKKESFVILYLASVFVLASLDSYLVLVRLVSASASWLVPLV